MSERVHPPVRPGGMKDFANQVTRDQIGAAFQSWYITKDPPRQDFHAMMHGHIDLMESKSRAPKWMSVEGLAYEVTRMNSLEVWEDIFASSGSDVMFWAGLDLTRKFNVQFKSHPSGLANYLSYGNKDFMGPAILGASLAVSINSGNASVFVPFLHKETREEKLLYRYEMEKEVSQRYALPVDTPEELLERVRTLLEGSENFEGLFDTLFRYGFFESDPSDAKWSKSCPGMQVTKMMFGEYAQLLRNPAYQKKFLKSVTVE